MNSMKSLIDDKKIVGTFNDPPPNFNEITVADFSQSMLFSYSPEKIEHRQITDQKLLETLGVKGYMSITMFWFHNGTGIGMHSDYWGKKVRYFKFKICEHFYTTIFVSNCYRVMECVKCGYTDHIDSSG